MNNKNYQLIQVTGFIDPWFPEDTFAWYLQINEKGDFVLSNNEGNRKARFEANKVNLLKFVK